MSGKIVYLILVILLVVSMNAGNIYAQEPKTRVLKFALTVPLENPLGQYAARFAEQLAKNTNNRIKITLYPNMQLGNNAEITEGVKFGTIDIVDNDFGSWATFLPRIGVFNAPYTFRNYDHLVKILVQDHPIKKELNEELVKKVGVRMLIPTIYGARNLITNRPVYHPNDLKGVKIRAVPWPIFLAAVEGMGAVATPVDWNEVPTAIATGLIDGLENALSVLYSYKFHKSLKYIMLTEHILGCDSHIINEKTFQSLTPDDQRILIETEREVQRWGMERVFNMENDFINKLKAEGATIIGPKEGLNLETIRNNVTAKVMEKFKDNLEWVALYKRIQESY